MTGNDVERARDVAEREWALEAYNARLSWHDMAIASARPESEGGLGRQLSLSAAKALFGQAKQAHGDLTTTREERRERQGNELDVRARAARHDMQRAYATLAERMPERTEYFDTTDALVALDSWRKRQELALKMIESADRRLGATHEREAKLFGLDAATRIEAEVTTRDAIYADLDAAIAALDKEEVSP